MEKRKLVRLTKLVERMDDFKYIQDIDADEYNFIFDERQYNVLPTDKFQFLMDLKKLNEDCNGGYKNDNYYAALIEAKKVSMYHDRELFMKYTAVAIDHASFTKPYNNYLDHLTIEFNQNYRSDIRAAKIKSKYLE